ncbi:MAG TPA: DUF362 domain-containing protein, partial [Magnetospirillaceae bacterium]|nr:DUF362 domain-containing protein [Magnetospirillaceae bacterium]
QASGAQTRPAMPDLVAVRGGSAASRVDAALAAAGGMGRYVRRGSFVVIKPNMSWDVRPELAANTDPAVVRRVVELCLAAGARRVVVFDNTCDAWRAAYANSGIERAAREAGAEVAPAHSETYYRAVDNPSGRVLRRVQVFEMVLEADVFLNIPVLKHHSGTGMTCALKNLMGAVWDRRFFHSAGLDTCIAELSQVLKPHLNIVDAGRVMLSGGPRGNASSRYSDQRLLLLSPDIVAADTAAARTLGPGPEAFEFIGKAAALGLGRMDLERLTIRRIEL